MQNLHARATKHNCAEIPAKLQRYRQFVVWRYENNSGKKPAKVPYSPHTGRKASVTDPQTWGTYDEARAAYNAEPWDGIGFVFTKDDPFAGIDLDKCRDPRTGTIEPGAAEILRRIGSYWETSPSGTGLHGIGEMSASLPAHGRKKGHVEIYEDKRFFTLTGDHIEGTAADITDCTEAVNTLHAEIFGQAEEKSNVVPLRPASSSLTDDDELLRRAMRARNGAKFTALWQGDTTARKSHSEADLALCSLIAWYTEDRAQIDRLFRQSGLYRKKWQRADYREKTIEKAMQSARKKKNAAATLVADCIMSIDTHAWQGPQGRIAQHIYMSLLLEMHGTGIPELAQSCRTGAEKTGYNYKTVARYLRFLTGEQRHKNVPVVLKKIDASDPSHPAGHAYSYRLLPVKSVEHLQYTVAQCEDKCSMLLHRLETLRHDAFRLRGRGLTKSAALVYCTDPCDSIPEIAERENMSRRTVYNALFALHRAGLMTQDENRDWVRTEETLDAVAQRRGTAGAGEEQKRLHQIQRDNYAAWLTRRARRKTMNVYTLRTGEPPDAGAWQGDWWKEEWRDAA